MKLSVIPATGHVALDGEGLVCDLSKITSELVDARTTSIHWNEAHGKVHRKSRVAGHTDTEHFDDVSLVAPFVAAFEARKAEMAAEAAKAEAERIARENKIRAELADLDRRNAEAAKAQAPRT